MDFYDHDGASKKKNIDSCAAENQTFLSESGHIVVAARTYYKSRRCLVVGGRQPCGLMVLSVYCEHWGKNTVMCVGTYQREDRVVEDKYSTVNKYGKTFEGYSVRGNYYLNTLDKDPKHAIESIYSGGVVKDSGIFHFYQFNKEELTFKPAPDPYYVADNVKAINEKKRKEEEAGAEEEKKAGEEKKAEEEKKAAIKKCDPCQSKWQGLSDYCPSSCDGGNRYERSLYFCFDCNTGPYCLFCVNSSAHKAAF